MNQEHQKQKHQAVLVPEVLKLLNPQAGNSYVDMTAGYGGHAAEVIKQTGAPQKTVLVDRDQAAIDDLNEQFGKSGVQILHDDFYSASRQLLKERKQFDLILADLGLSSPHINIASRGFSFVSTGPLDMRMDQRQATTAYQVVNDWDKSQLETILRELGEEPRAQRVAEAIVKNRPITSTTGLAEVVSSVLPRTGKIHPATKVFQAIRVAVNSELELLDKTLPLWLELLKPGGRIAVISFHSLEDRLVKQFFKDKSEGRYSAELKLLTKNPVSPSANEIVLNPRARSAKLRAAVKIKRKKG